MANEEHYQLLIEAINQERENQGLGKEIWNNWRVANPTVIPDLSGANLLNCSFEEANFEESNLSGANLEKTRFSGGNFRRANLNGAILRESILIKANLSGANLTGVDLYKATLYGANLERAILSKVQAGSASFGSADLKKADLSSANFDSAQFSNATLNEAILSNSNFDRANFFKAKLIKTNLSNSRLIQATFSEADLTEANLSKSRLINTRALATDFESAILTGACIQDWHINNKTNLSDIICDYVYLKQNLQERRPHSGNFAPREFTKLFQKARETVDLIFRNGVDWQAFLVSFEQLQVEAGDKALFIQAIENKNDGAFVIRVSVPPELDKAEIEKYFKQKYQKALKVRDEQYRKHLRERLKDKDDLIANYREKMIEMKSIRQDNTQLIAIIKTMAEKEDSKYYFIQPQIGNFIDTAQSGSRQQSINNQYNYAPEQKQTLAEAVEEIQKLLKQLEVNNPTATEAEKIAYINDETTPSFKRRVVGALQAFGETAIDEFVLENKWLKVIKETFKRWMKPE